MAMLAEPKRKAKFVLTPKSKPLWTSESNGIQFGKKLMEKMGWNPGEGLGALRQGIQEPLRQAFKQDTKGMGYSGDGNPFENLDEFNALLSSLTKDTPVSEDVSHSFESLEEKSKHSKSRVHYQKFTRGKDLAKYSAVDLTCIVGTGKKPKKEEEEVELVEDRTGETENSHGVTTIMKGFVADYFKQKMCQLKGMAADLKLEPENEDEPKKKKKKKSDCCEVLLETVGEESERVDEEVSSKRKKKKKKKQEKEDKVENNEIGADLLSAGEKEIVEKEVDEQRVSKNKKKKKDKDREIENGDEREDDLKIKKKEREVDLSEIKEEKKKKKHKTEDNQEENDCIVIISEDSTNILEHTEVEEEVLSRKKKKRKHQDQEMKLTSEGTPKEASINEEDNNVNCSKKKKKKKDKENLEVFEEKSKKKKKKKSKEREPNEENADEENTPEIIAEIVTLSEDSQEIITEFVGTNLNSLPGYGTKRRKPSKKSS